MRRQTPGRRSSVGIFRLTLTMNRKRVPIVSLVKSCAGVLALELMLLVFTERPAKAYVDPGSGALVWQGLLAALVGSAFYCRRIVGWVRARLFRGKEN